MKKAFKIYEVYQQNDNSNYLNQCIIRFIRVIRQSNISVEGLFKEADTSGDGNIDLIELKDCLKKHGGFSDKELEAIMKFMDVDGDGAIDKKEYLNQMTKAIGLYESNQ